MDGRGKSSHPFISFFVGWFELPRMVSNKNICCKLPYLLWLRFLALRCQEHNISYLRKIFFWKPLYVDSNIIPNMGHFHVLVVHLNSESFPLYSTGSKGHHFVGFQNPLFEPSCDDIPNTLNLVHTRNRHSKRLFLVTLWWLRDCVQCFEKRHSLEFVLLNCATPALVPWHFLITYGIAFVCQINTKKSRHGNEWYFFRLVSYLSKHFLDLTLDPFESALAPVAGLFVHLVYSNYQLLDSQ